MSIDDQFNESVLKTMTNNYEIFNEVNKTLLDIKSLLQTNNTINPDVINLLEEINNNLKQINTNNIKIDEIHTSIKTYIPGLLGLLIIITIGMGIYAN